MEERFVYNGNTKIATTITDKDGNVKSQQEQIIVDWIDNETKENQNSTKLIEKWENIGFLDKTKNKRNLALACELSCLYLLDNTEKYNGYITTLISPVIVRIFRKIENNLPTQIIFNKVIEIITEFSIKFNEFQNSDEWINRGNINEKDVEAEFIAKFTDNFLI